jgi:PmbA protein
MATLTPREIMDRVRTQAERSGVAEAETYLEVVTFREVRVRQREIELIQQSAIKGLGLRVYRDQRMGFLYTTDLRQPVLDEIVNRTIALAGEATPRDENKLPDEIPPPMQELEIHDASVASMPPADQIALARAAEENAFARDRRVKTTRDARCGTQVNEVHFTNTFLGYQTYRTTTCWLGVGAIATDGTKQREGWFSDRKRILLDLETPERVGRKAADRALAKLGAAPVPSAKVPVVFESEAAGQLLSGLFGAFSGQNVLEQRSFLAGSLGKPVASPLLTISDEGLLRRGLGTRPFDGEGVQSRNTLVVDRGLLKAFLTTSVSGRRMGRGSTGNANRSYDSLPAIGPTNFHVERGNTRPDKMISDVPKGLYVTELAGFGIDIVSGEFSQQVVGRWIEGGKLAQPVEGITLGGNLGDMLLGIDAVGNDLEYRSNVSSPSLRFKELTIGGA